MVGLSQAKQNRLRGLFEIRPCDWVTAATDQTTWVDARDTLTSKNSASFFSLELSIIELSKSVEQKSGSILNCPQQTHPFKPADTLSIADTFSKEGSTNNFCVTKWYLGDIATLYKNHKDK